MYSHLIKGFSIGQLLTRRLLRRITSIPGVIIDACVAMFWAPHYSDYWNNYTPYADNTRAGVIEGIFGWVGEVVGIGLGGILGLVLGVVVYGIDSLLSLVRHVQQNLYSSFDRLNQFIVDLSPAFSFPIKTQYSNYLDKAINIGSFILGGLIAAAPLLATKILEFFVPPIENYSSQALMYTCGWLGGATMFLIALPMFPLVYLFKRGVELYSSLREVVRFSVAVIYGKTGTLPALDNANDIDCIFPEHTLHSTEFRADVLYARESSWAILIRNGFQRPAPVAIRQPAPFHAVRPPPIPAPSQVLQNQAPPAYDPS
ncbi:MAG: hypothetical protein H0U75_12655 [Legionella sp.]|nr:hypothetical protein [Legionella sp.]